MDHTQVLVLSLCSEVVKSSSSGHLMRLNNRSDSFFAEDD